MKALLLAPCLALAVFLTGCTKKNYYTTNPGITFQATAQASDWQYSATENSYVLSINTPELDQTGANNDAVVVSISYPSSTGGQTGIFETIPEVYNNIAYSYIYSAGNVTIYAQAPNGTALPASPGAMTIKVAIISSTAE